MQHSGVISKIVMSQARNPTDPLVATGATTTALSFDLSADPAYGVVQPLSVIVRWSRQRFYDKIVERSNLKLDRSTISILDVLKRQGPMRTSDLADSLGLDRSTISRQVTSAIALGFVAREGDPRDARAAMLSLTDEGRAKQQKLAHAWLTIAMDLVADWSFADQVEIARLLGRLADKIEEDYRP
jgi:DNA-binding MarR family transcriptional regulator